MKIDFYKFQGTGNDFVLLDNRDNKYTSLSTKQIAFLCDRRFGIGADGLMLLESHSSLDFKMVYFNSDGNESTMCGNGGRCIVAFSKLLGISNSEVKFEAIDGVHKAKINSENVVDLEMIDVSEINTYEDDYVLDTGSPHYVSILDDVSNLDVFNSGKEIRNSVEFKENGINVNFVSKIDNDSYKVRTYERGVEDETFSCGTGVTASVIALNEKNLLNNNEIKVSTLGGDLEVKFDKKESVYTNIWLCGPATFVFKGVINV